MTSVRRVVLWGVALAVLGGTLLGPAALAAPSATVVAQEEERPTATQPSPGTPFTPSTKSEPWSYTWVARPFFFVIVPLFILALLGGFVVRWVGVGRRRAT